MKSKTWSSELAYGLLAFWIVLTLKMFYADTPEYVEVLTPVYANITTILLPVVFGALGFKRFVNSNANGPV